MNTTTWDSQAGRDNWAGLLTAVAEGVTALRQTLEERPRIYSLALHDLGSPGYELVQPLSIIVEEYESEGAIARCPELDAFGEGSTPSAAIGDLKNVILDLYDDLVATDPTALGELPIAWLGFLRRTVVKAAA